MPSLFEPIQIGAISAPNRIVMAPLTRNRAAAGRMPSALMATYYTQRASAGLIVSEATQISPSGQGYLDTPGIYDAAQVAAWRLVTDAVHGANGYLLDQFLRDSINDRSDAYGGSRENRARLPLDVLRAVVAEIGAERTGLRLSPVTPSNDAGQDSDPQGLFNHLVNQLNPLRLAYIHVIEGATGGARDVAPFDFAALKACYQQGHERGVWIVNNGYTRAMALAAVADGAADAVAFGKPFISNPDLVARLRADAPLAPLDPATLYGGGAAGYTDYAPL